ncbi:ribosome biogenesis protein ENP2 [Nematocida parisii]|nr:ribosome biogenesis protein ENP2 [Nematocida parisii]KAI5125474.1 ribosome biogenesis protein ENP2 [Nematocida parisii]KAI5140644.1 ribosome biogenesis protein ENP2 [Nematocida parisii]
MVNATEVTILHGFEFPTYCNYLEVSEDSKTLLATGGYKPATSLFDLQEHTLKVERHADYELIKGGFIGEDWTKIVLLSNVAKIEFQTQFGKHDSVSLPQQCRDVKVDKIHANVVLAGKTGGIHQFSMSTGKFLPSITTQLTSAEEFALNQSHTLCAIVGSSKLTSCSAPDKKGICEFIDSRDNKPVRQLFVDAPATSCAFSENGMLFGVGTEAGIISLYDIRSARPIIEKDHNYDFKIKKIEIKDKKVLSLDQKGVKVWKSDTGKVLATIQPSFDVNSFTSSEGIVFVGGNSEPMKTYYVPALGAIPEWCSNLEGVTEEMNEMQKMTYYDQYRFITEDELILLKLQKEVGKAVKPHMHGYLIQHTLYNKHIESNKRPNEK